ncbi:hypothetical protein [Nocardia sp. A7]|uniref:hypothetical protein n=1 Tax=Nocardia sp. A7 TaxID=2789274 RepID=UPI00397BD916
MTVVELRRAEPGLLVIAPDGAPLVTDAAPALDVMVLEVVGGHLSWGLLDGTELPAAVLDDVDAAQYWVWAVYGEAVALAVAGSYPQSLTAVPARPDLVAALRRLAYAHWVSRWWPASTVDGIPSLDSRLLVNDIEFLTDACEMVLDTAAHDDATESGLFESQGAHDASAGRDTERAETHGRANDYALAAGGADQTDGLIVARGSGGWDWRCCPPGILDASERAVSWQVTRAAGVSIVRVSVVAAPNFRRAVPEHLRPFARLQSVRAQPPAVGVRLPLHLRGDTWTGVAEIPGPPETSLEVAVFVPGVGPADPVEESVVRDRIRRFARLRLSDPTGDLLTAETAAAEADEDF